MNLRAESISRSLGAMSRAKASLLLPVLDHRITGRTGIVESNDDEEFVGVASDASFVSREIDWCELSASSSGTLLRS